MMGRSVDVVETSRGCTYDCSFCSIIEMRGRNFHTWGLDRVIADIADARARGAGVIFLVDDNITLNVPRFRALCRAITDAGLNDIDFIVQGMTSAMLAGGDDLAREMRTAGFRYVFLGIENVLDADLRFLRAGAKNARAAGRQDRRQREHPGHRAAAPARDVRGWRPDRREPRRYARVGRGESGVCAHVRRLALHPAPHALPWDPDDARLPRRWPDRQRG